MYKDHLEEIKSKGILGLIIVPFIIVLLTYIMPSLVQLLFVSFEGDNALKIGSIGSVAGMVSVLVVMPIVMFKVSKIRLKTLGITGKNLLLNILKGGVFGLLFLSIVAISIYVLGGVSIEINSFDISIPFIMGLLFFVCQGTWEELMYRAYLMPMFSKKMGTVWSIIITSALFTLGHALNPNMQVLPVVNLFIASVFFSVVYYYYGNLFIVGIGHGIWNFSQGYIFGAEVSGNSIPYSILKSIPSSNEIISGGGFGFEGSIVTTIVGIILILLFVYRIRKVNPR